MTQPEDKVMGGDGQEYGQIHAGQIRQWFAEGRLEKKSPVIPPGAKDWVFLESLPEFADLFQPPAPKKQIPLPWKLVIVAGVVFAVMLGLLVVLHINNGHH